MNLEEWIRSFREETSKMELLHKGDLFQKERYLEIGLSDLPILPEEYLTTPTKETTQRLIAFNLPVQIITNEYLDNEEVLGYIVPHGWRARFLFEQDKEFPHCNDHVELAYVYSGDYVLEIDGKEHWFKSKDFILMDRNCMHRELGKSRCIVLFICIAEDNFENIFLSCLPEGGIRDFLYQTLQKRGRYQQYLRFRLRADEEKFEQMLAQILYESEKREMGYSYICKGCLIRMFDIITRQANYVLSCGEQEQFNRMQYEDVVQYMSGHLADISLDMLEKQFHYQRDFFRRLLMEYGGKNYMDTLQELRLQNAEFLLNSSDYSVEEIAALVGYSNCGHFYRKFKERYGQTPKKYRTSRNR